MDLAEYAALDAIGLAQAIRDGLVTQADVHELALTAHHRVHERINGVVALAEPAEGDGARPTMTGPLAGVPTMVKDLFHGQVGLACGNGSRLCEGWQVQHRSQIYGRAVSAGLTSIGRTTTSEFGIMGTTETLACGITRSPWSEGHMAGGSSGGAGAVVAAGVVPVALASDGGGSIRIPAAACGVVGLKPSRGRIPWGLRLKEPLLGWATQFAVSRTVRDTALMLDLLSGPTPGDGEGLPAPQVPYIDAIGSPPKALRIAYCTTPWSGHEPDPVVTDATLATARMLVDLGHHVEEATPVFSWEAYLQAMTDVWAATNAQSIDAFASAVSRPVDATTVEGATLEMVEYGRAVPAQRLLKAIDVESAITLVMSEFFRRFDVLVTPTLAAVLPPVAMYDPEARTAPCDTFERWSRWEAFLPVWNTTGNPAISLPLHATADGLPIGMQLVAGFGREDTLLRLSATLEEALPWRHRHPRTWAGLPPA